MSSDAVGDGATHDGAAHDEAGRDEAARDGGTHEATAHDGTTPVRTASPSRGTVLAAGHLHPGMLFLRFVDGVRGSILPLLIALIAQQVWLAAATAVFFVLGMVYAVVRYLTFQYRLTEDELVTTEGILHRQERRIPVDRVQDLSFESTLLRRVFGLVVVSVETASGQGAEARLDSLGRADAAHLREVLYGIRARRGLRTQREEEVQQTRLFRASAGELTLLGLTSNRIGAILLAVLGFLELADELGASASVAGAASGVFARIAEFSPPLVVVFGVALLFLLLILGWILSIGASMVLYHGFTLSLREDVLLRRFGLLTTRAQSLPRVKVQRVLLEQGLLRRVLGLVVVRADSAGSGGSERGSARSGRDVVVPLTAVGGGETLVASLLPGMAREPLPWQRVSGRLVWRVFFKGVLLAGLLIGVGLPSVGAVAWLALAALPLSGLVGALAWQNLAYARVPGHVAFRWGVLGRYRAFVPLRKVQGALLRAGPVERVLGLAQITVFVAGGSPTTLPYLPRDEAEHVVRDVARQAARSRFVW